MGNIHNDTDNGHRDIKTACVELFRFDLETFSQNKLYIYTKMHNVNNSTGLSSFSAHPTRTLEL